MQKSTEIRWFISEADFTFLERLFAKENLGLNFNNIPTFNRKDLYLKNLNNSLGIKIREPKSNSKGLIISKLEIKTQIGESVEFKDYNNIEGQINTWIKHSFDLLPDERYLKQILQSLNLPSDSLPWLMIEKERQLVKYDTGIKAIVNANVQINEGAGLELTKLKINNKNFFSFGLEAFSNSETELSNLKKTLEFFHNRFKPNGLSFLNSHSYPEFISSEINQLQL